MEILKDIEKNILSINMYSKDTEAAKLNLIKKQIADYLKYKSDENNVITQKIMKYDELYKNPRERNAYEYELFLEKKEELYNIYRDSKALGALYDYLNYKYENGGSESGSGVPDIYTYAHINLNERAKVVKEDNKTNVCPEGKMLNPKTKRCVKDPSYKKPKEPKEPKVAPPKEPKEPPKEPKVAPPKEPKVAPPKEPKVAPPKEPKAPKVKECPEGKILNPKTNRCIKDPSYKKPKDAKPPE